MENSDYNQISTTNEPQPDINHSTSDSTNLADLSDRIDDTNINTETTTNSQILPIDNPNINTETTNNIPLDPEFYHQEELPYIEEENQEITSDNIPTTALIPEYYNPQKIKSITEEDQEDQEDQEELPEDVEMSFFDHLEELRQRLFYAIIAFFVCTIGAFIFVKDIVQLLEVPAKGIKFLQLAPGEFFFVSIKVAGYSGLLLASPFILYQTIIFILPGLTRREKQLLTPVVLGSSILFFGGLVFAYLLLIPAALKFLIGYGADVVEQMWSIERYFEFVLVLLFGSGLIFQIPILQILLSLLGIVSADKMLSGWRYVIVSAVVIGAVVTPSTDPLTQSLLAGAVLLLYFGGIAIVKLLGK
jgi:sec-independent protein translocase protein TatC